MDSIRPVAVLSYQSIGPDPAPPHLAFECSAFTLQIEDGMATFKFLYPPYSAREGERHLQEFLTSFEGDLLLRGTPGLREFRLASGEFVDGGCFGNTLYLTLTVGGPKAEANGRRAFPWRYHRFSTDDLVSALIARYEEYRRGREKLLVMTFLSLTALEATFGGRKALGIALNIDKRILSRIGELVSNYGTLLTARKISHQHKDTEPSPAEFAWIEWITRELILRAGIVRQDSSHSEFDRLSGLPGSVQEDGG